jgi:hypothetical protein
LKILTYINALGEELEFTNSAPFLLQKFTESTNVNIYSSKGMNQNGKKYLGNTLSVKDIALQIAIIATNKEELINYRNRLNKIFNPTLGEGWLIYKDDVKEWKVECISNKMPFLGVINSSANTCLISLTANKPFWEDILESKEEIALWKGDFGFELELIAGGIEVGHREPSLIVNVLNNGDVESGMRVEFKALATVVNPSILNINTGEYLKIIKTMETGEIISVSTYFGNKKVESKLNGVTTNAFNYIDFQSTFLQLDVGDNLFRYNADTNLDNLEVNIYHTPTYLGV